MLDHNNHTERDTPKTRKGDERYHRKYQKASKQWDATPVMSKKKYLYIPPIIDEIIEEYKAVGHIPPSATSEIVSNKWSRFK